MNAITNPVQVNRQADPTRTLTLRTRYARDMRRRFRLLERLIWDAVVVKNVFGSTDDLQQNIQVNNSGLRPRQFEFLILEQKITAFLSWLEQQVENNILEVSSRGRIGSSISPSWQNLYVEDSYKRGVQRAVYELGRIQYPGLATIAARGGLSMVMSNPFHVDRLGVLFIRNFTDLRGITNSMDSMISRVLTQGLADGDNPRLIGRRLLSTINGQGAGDLGLKDRLGRFIPPRRRAEILSRSEVIRAHHQGMFQEYKNWGLQGVRIQSELRTAGDNRVCEQCSALEGDYFPLDEAQNIIPVHPQCRCIMLPVRLENFTTLSKQRVGASCH